MARILYITYDGLTDPLGRSQILPYLAGCAARGHQITILSCEKRDRFERGASRIREICARAGIEWRPLRYHKRPPVLSTAYDAMTLTRQATRLNRARRFDLVHCRSYIPGIAGLRLKRRQGVPLLFDMRGFWPEERVEGGNWDLSRPLYRAVYDYFKRLESQLYRSADHLVSLTEAGKRQLLSRPELRGRGHDITIIPCCVDLDHFQPSRGLRETARARLGIDQNARVLAYVGSVGGNYMLDEMLDFFRAYRARHAGARFLFVTMEDPRTIAEAAARRKVDPDCLVVRAAAREEVPTLIAAADAGVAFKQPSFSAEACSPTKLGEILAMGVPVVANTGVGEVDAVLNASGGAIVPDFDEASYAGAIDRLDASELAPEEIRAYARRIFDLDAGVERYSTIYDGMASSLALRNPA